MVDSAKRYVAYKCLQLADELILKALDLMSQAETWNKKGLTPKERTFQQRTRQDLVQVRSRQERIVRRMQGSIDEKYGWPNASD